MVVKANSEKMEREAALLEAQLREVKAKQNQLDIAKRMAALQQQLDDALDPKGAAKRAAKAERKAAEKAARKAQGAEPALTPDVPSDTPKNGGIKPLGVPTIPDYNTHR